MKRFKDVALVCIAYAYWIMNLFRSRTTKKLFVIFHTGQLGDLVCLTSVFRAVKESLPEYQLVVYARKPFVEVLKDNPYVDRIRGFSPKELMSRRWLADEAQQLRKECPEYFVNCMRSIESNAFGVMVGAPKRKRFVTDSDSRLERLIPGYDEYHYRYDRFVKHGVLDMLASWGIRGSNTQNQLFFEGDSSKVDDWFQSNAIDKDGIVIGTSVSSGKDFKRWPKEHWIELLTRLTQTYHAWIVFFGTQQEREEIESIRSRVLGKTIVMDSASLTELPYFLKRCSLFVSVDTGPQYIADAMDVPVVNIFGSCDEVTQRPERRFRLVTNREVCPTVLKTPSLPLSSDDLIGIDRCFNAISVDQVFGACRELL